MSMPVAASYEGDGARSCFPIPFPYGGVSDIGVRIISGGVESGKVYLDDYRLVENSVYMLTPPPAGSQLVIYLKTSISQAEAARAERVRAAVAAGITESAAAWHAERAAHIACDAAAEAARAAGESVRDIQAKAAQEKEKAASEIGSVLAAAASQAQQLGSEVSGLCSSLEDKKTLAITEIANSVSSARSEMSTFKAAVCAEAREYCEIQKQAARQNVLASADEMRTAANAAAEAVNKSILDIYRAADECMARVENPGLSAIRAKAELEKYSRGFFIINPFIKESKASLGLWPCRKADEIQWAGFHVIIPPCPGHDRESSLPAYPPLMPVLPETIKPADPDNPTDPGSPGASGASGSSYYWNGMEWLPCRHVHA